MLWALGGFFSEASDWDFLRPHLKNNSIRIPRLWDAASTRLTLNEWAARFCDEVRAQDSDPALVGYSLGGRLATHALLRADHPFRRATLVSTHFGLNDEAEKTSRELNDEKWAERLLHQPWNELQAAWNAQPVFSGEKNPFERRESSFSRPALAEAMRHWSLARQDYLLPRLHEIQIPVTIVAGEKDLRFKEQAEAAHAQLNLGQLAIVSGQGHRLLWTESAERVASLLGLGSP